MKIASVVMVANGPSLLTKRLGAKIDSFDRVIRINHFATNGHHPHVGLRTDIWSTSLVNWDRHPSEFLEVWFLSHLKNHAKVYGTLMSHGPHVNGRFMRNWPETVWYVGSDVFGPLYDELGYTTESHLWPSTGLLSIAAMLYRFPDAELNICGFDCFKDAKVGEDTPHYFAEPSYSVPVFSGRHDPAKERAYIAGKIKEGRLVDLGA